MNWILEKLRAISTIIFKANFNTTIQKQHPHSLKEALSTKFSEEELRHLTKAFDIIGDIAIIEIPNELQAREKEIAESIMQVHRNIKVVAKKLGGMAGEYRVRPIKVIFGENRTETEYHESGCRMRFDVAKTYFSVRLSHERERIAALVNNCDVKDGEKILALFAGVGPFPLVIARKNKGKPLRIAAIEMNPDAAKYMKENVRLNKMDGIIEPIEGDARKVVMDRFRNWADRVLMPLPKSAHDFLDVAFAGAKNGAIVHFYSFAEEEKAFEDAKEKVDNAAKEAKTKVEILNQKIVRPYAPHIVQTVTDFRVIKSIGKTTKPKQ